jgi:flagellar export protein FliJ
VSRLAAVLRVRTIQERRARGVLAVSNREHRAAELEERGTWSALDARLRTRVAEGAPTGATLLAERAIVESGMLAADTQHHATERAAEAVAAAKAEWTIAARRVEGLQRLEERLEAEAAEERQRKAANELDDLVLAKFGRDPGGIA